MPPLIRDGQKCSPLPFFLYSCIVEHFHGIIKRSCRDINSGCHASDFIELLTGRQTLYFRYRFVAASLLVDVQMGISHTGDLRQMRYAENLFVGSHQGNAAATWGSVCGSASSMAGGRALPQLTA